MIVFTIYEIHLITRLLINKKTMEDINFRHIATQIGDSLKYTVRLQTKLDFS